MPKQRSAHRVRSNPSAPAGIVPLIVNAARGTLIAILVGALLLFAMTAAAYAQNDPDRLTAPIGYAVTSIVALLSGFLASHRSRRAVLLCGLLSAACLLAVFALLSLVPAGTPSQVAPLLSLALHGALIPLTTFGAYLGRRRGRH